MGGGFRGGCWGWMLMIEMILRCKKLHETLLRIESNHASLWFRGVEQTRQELPWKKNMQVEIAISKLNQQAENESILGYLLPATSRLFDMPMGLLLNDRRSCWLMIPPLAQFHMTVARNSETVFQILAHSPLLDLRCLDRFDPLLSRRSSPTLSTCPLGRTWLLPRASAAPSLPNPT